MRTTRSVTFTETMEPDGARTRMRTVNVDHHRNFFWHYADYIILASLFLVSEGLAFWLMWWKGII